MEELKKTAKIIDVFLKIMFIIVLVGLIAAAVASVLLLAIGPMNIESGEIAYSIGGLRFVLADGLDELASFSGTQMIQDFLTVGISGLIGMAVILVGIKMLREIIAPMKDGGPFVEGISRKMRNFGCFIIISGVVGNIVQFIGTLIVRSSFFALLEQSEYVSSVVYENIFDGSFIILALFVFLLSYIFRYGEELQKQSDETL